MEKDDSHFEIPDIELSNTKQPAKEDYSKVSTEDRTIDSIPPKLHNQIEEQFTFQSIRFFQYGKIGHCYSLFYTTKGVPLIVIGPDWIVYVFLSISMSIATYSFFWFFCAYMGNYTKTIGMALYAVFMLSYTSMLLINPGFPGYGSYSKAIDEEVVYCPDCKIYLPSSGKYMHCNECGLCIEGRDHHCQWTSKCVGKRNMKFFYSFCISLFTLILYFILSLIVIQGNYLNKNAKKI